MTSEDVPAIEVPLPPTPLTGDGVSLRVWEPEDASWYVRSRDAEVYQWTSESPDLTVDQARAAIEKYREHPTHAGFAIIDRQTRQLIGNIALVLSKSDRTAEISCWLAPEGRGRGAATAAVRLVTSWAFKTLRQLHRIELQVLPDNLASHRVAERAGFERESLLRKHKRIKGVLRDVVVYSMSRAAAG